VNGTWLSLTHYAGGARQARHVHDFHQISFLVVGSLRETLDGREFELHCPSAAWKPAGVPHEDDWGPHGALVFSINVQPANDPFGVSAQEPRWADLPRAYPLRRLIASAFVAADATCSAGGTHDAAKLLSGTQAARRRPPAWLEEVRAALAEENGLAVHDAAAAAGVDRAHLCRMFQRHYGLPPSVYRRRVLASRALATIASTTLGLSRVACQAGFSDQPHMNRVLRAETGLPPNLFRRLLSREITSVQDGAPSGA
jgi:AraC-like DNA-binding protein